MSFFWRGTISARARKAWSTISHAFYLDLAPADATIFVSGSPRSGTTWLAEVLNSDNAYRFLGEPFTAGLVPPSNHFLIRQYLRPADDDPRYLKPARAIFAGKIRNAWVDNVNRCAFPRGRIVKDVRTTLMLKWFRAHFPRMPIVYLVRHPCAVALSRVRLAFRTDFRKVYFAQPALMEDFLAPFADEIARAQTPFERHIVDWCVESFVPFAQLERSDVFLAFYENLCSSEAELRKLFEYTGRPFNDAIARRIHRPSLSTMAKGRGSQFFAQGTAVDAWRRQITPDELAAAQRITKAFGLEHIYGDNTLANAEQAKTLLRGGVKKERT